MGCNLKKNAILLLFLDLPRLKIIQCISNDVIKEEGIKAHTHTQCFFWKTDVFDYQSKELQYLSCQQVLKCRETGPIKIFQLSKKVHVTVRRLSNPIYIYIYKNTIILSPGRDGLLLCELYVHFLYEGVFVFPRLNVFTEASTRNFALDVSEDAGTQQQRGNPAEKLKENPAHLIGCLSSKKPGNRPDRMFPSVLLSNNIKMRATKKKNRD